MRARVERGEHHADEPEVVVEREPAHDRVGRLHVEGFVVGGELRLDLVVAEEHSARLARRPRGELEERGARGLEREDLARLPRGPELLVGQDRLPREADVFPDERDEALVEDGDSARGRVGDRAERPQVVVESREACRRVNGDGDHARVGDPEERLYEVEPAREHDEDAVSGLEPALLEGSRDRERPRIEIAVGEAPLVPVAVREERDEGPRRVRRGAPPRRRRERR